MRHPDEVRSEPFDVVREGYDRIGARYREWSADGPVRLQWVDRLLRLLAPGSVVVDLGCGPGYPATRLIAGSHRVIGLDASHAQLLLAREAAPSASLVQADMTRFNYRPASLDAVVSFYAFGHVPSHLHAPLLANIAGWLRPGGLLMANTPCGTGDDIEPEWLGVDMFFGGIGEGATKQALSAAGLHLDVFETVMEDEGGGHRVGFNWLIAHKPRTE